MTLVKKIFWFPFLFLLLAACADTSGESASIAGEPVFSEASEGMPAIDQDAGASMNGNFTGSQFETSEFQERLIVRTGSLDVIVEDTEETIRAISRLASARGGWVLNSNVFESAGVKSGDISIRIPADRFEETMSDIKQLALETPSEFTDSQDVTEEYIDLEARLTNLEATADRVRSFLDDARNVEDALAVNRELSQLESEIEVIKGRMQFLSQSAAFSTLQVHITPDQLSQPLEVGGWTPQGIARSAVEALISALQGFGTIAIWAGVFCLPLIIIVGFPAFLLFRYGNKRWRSRKKSGNIHDEEE